MTAVSLWKSKLDYIYILYHLVLASREKVMHIYVTNNFLFLAKVTNNYHLDQRVQ